MGYFEWRRFDMREDKSEEIKQVSVVPEHPESFSFLYAKNPQSEESLRDEAFALGYRIKDRLDPKTSKKDKLEETETNPKDLIGAKKPRLSLVPSTATIQLALAMQNGADKYGAYNWREKKVQTMIYVDAFLRHALSYLDGEDVAEDSGIKHLSHAMACLAIILDAEENGCLIDNRPKKGNASDLLKRHTKTS